MKKPIAILMTAIMILSIATSALPLSACAATDTDDQAQGSEGAPSEGDTSSMKFTLKAGEYEITKDENDFDVIQMEGFSLAVSPGDPMLPHKVYNILVPPDVIWSSLQLKIISAETRILDGTYDIKPAPPPLPGTESTKIGDLQKDRNATVYETDASFPETSVELLPYSQMRKWKFTRVDFAPFQYNPVSKELTLTESVVIEITYSQSRAELDERLMADTVMDDIAPQIFLNYDEARSWYEQGKPIKPQQTYEYVIITTNAIKANSAKLASFVTHKQNLGHSVLVVTYEDDISGLTGQAPNHRAEKIRQWLINNYAAMGIEYVLLIGDPHPYESGEGDIPMKMCHPERNQVEYDCEQTPTDYFYADLTGNWDIDGDQYYGEWLHDYPVTGGVDFTPEVYVGRIPVYSADYTTLDNILQKIIDYETEPEGSVAPGDISWRESILMPMGFQYIGYDGAMLAEQMKDDYLGAAGFTSWRMYQQGNGACGLDSTYTSEEELRGHPNTPNVRNRWASTDFGIVAWWGHGNPTQAVVGYSYVGYPCIDGMLLQSSDCSVLDDEHPAFTYQCSCTNGYPEHSNNLQYAILKQGGIATVSATRVSWFSTGVEYGEFDGSPTNSGIGYEYVDRLVQGLPGGQAMYQAKQSMTPNHQCWLMNWYDFNLYGDPETSLVSTGVLEPDIWVDPTSFDVTLPPDTTWSDIMEIGNDGEGTLTYSIADRTISTPSSVSIPASDGNFPQGSSQDSIDLAPVPVTQTEELAIATGFVLNGGGEPAYAIDISWDKLVYIPDTTAPGTWDIVGTTGISGFFAGDFLNGDFSKMYALNYYDNKFYTVDTTTAAATLIGTSYPVSGQVWTGMTGATDGTLYASSTDIYTSYLYTIDPASGAVTVVGEITNAPCIIDIAINAAGEMYGVDIVNDVLVEIDPATGAGTVVGSIGFDANFAQGMDFEEESGVLYLAAYNNYYGEGQLRIADTSTGNTVLVGTFPDGDEVDCLAFTTGGGGDCPWLDENPKKGSVPPGEYDEITVNIDTTGLALGDYSADIIIHNNDPDENPTIVPVTLTVIEPRMYLHSVDPIFDPRYPINEPIRSDWHELYPEYCNMYHLTSWHDNGDGVLSPCDDIDMTDEYGNVAWYHVDEVTVTIFVSSEYEEPKYLEFTGGYEEIKRAMYEPVCTYWHEVWPEFCRQYHLDGWKDNGDGYLSYCDYISLRDLDTGEVSMWHVEEVTTDIILSPKPCEPSIDVDKTVWDPDSEEWVDEVTVQVCETVRFKGVIHNDGTCCDLTDIVVTDILSESLEYKDSATVDGEPWEPVPVGPNEYQWEFPDRVLHPCETITIEFDAHAVEPGEDVNTMYAGGVCEETGEEVEDKDTATVNVISTDNKVYFVPQHSIARGYCKTTEVEIWVNATEFGGGQINMSYDPTCANVTNWVRNTTNFLMGGWSHYDGREWITFSTMDPQPPLLTGEYMVGTLTIHCVDESKEGCETPLAFIEGSELKDDIGKPVPANFIDGTFECTPGLCGDVAPYPDCDGKVDMGDVILLLNNVSYPENPRYVLCNEWAGDCRCSGKIDMGDVILLLNNVSYPENPRYVLDCCD